ncbi:hypothetical protein L218DRAFT_620556 [Marasmius fiardii PR-910]|nr:hypothetical protein L218DRAFT_620556 [Marasmius fiardii PR-910]
MLREDPSREVLLLTGFLEGGAGVWDSDSKKTSYGRCHCSLQGHWRHERSSISLGGQIGFKFPLRSGNACKKLDGDKKVLQSLPTTDIWVSDVMGKRDNCCWTS